MRPVKVNFGGVAEALNLAFNRATHDAWQQGYELGRKEAVPAAEREALLEAEEAIEARLAADVAAYNDHGFIGDNQCMTDRAYLLTELRKRDEVIARATTLIHDLTDRAECHFDHHGGCQAHGYLSLEPGETCPQYDAKQWAAVTAAKGDGE
ncbi:MAG TPA: hypothetical protein VIM08_15105 [Arthrobacter sp.]|jgi:dienelactone hydrolase